MTSWMIGMRVEVARFWRALVTEVPMRSAWEVSPRMTTPSAMMASTWVLRATN